MSRSELAKVVTVLDSAANKRLKRLSQAPMGTESIVYQNAMKIGKFSVKGKNQGELQAEYKRVKQFLTAKTSSARGWNTFRAKTIERIGGEFSSEKQEKDFWKIYRDLAESDAHSSLIRSDSTQAQRFLRDEWVSRQSALTDDEKKTFRDFFPNDKRDLENLSRVDKIIVRTMINQERHYRKQFDVLGASDGSITIESKPKI